MFHLFPDQCPPDEEEPVALDDAEIIRENTKLLREDLWGNGFRPVAVASITTPCTSPGKQPLAAGWQDSARLDPPKDAKEAVEDAALNTGILCDGLRPVDIDVNKADLVAAIRDKAVEILGDGAPVRFRDGSPRILMLYRAAEGEPKKTKVWNKATKDAVEILGHGQQFVADGLHHTGALIQWEGDRRPDFGAPRESLPAVTEEQIEDFLAEVADILGCEAPAPAPLPSILPSTVGASSSRMTIEDVRSALERISAEDYDQWIRVVSAVLTVDDGFDGFMAVDEWSRTSIKYDPQKVRRKWNVLRSNPLSRVSAGTLVHLARETDPEWRIPSTVRPTMAMLAAQKPALPAAKPVSNPFAGLDGVYSETDLFNQPPPKWLVPGLLLENTVAMIYGPPRSYKSFIVLDLAMSLSRGMEWNGKQLEKMPVLYLAAEGGNGMGMRMEAWSRHNGVFGQDGWFGVIKHPIDLTSVSEVGNLISRLKGTGTKLLVIDTLARCSGDADENSASEMKAAIDGAMALKDALGCTVLLVHHSGKDAARGPRGSNRLLGDLDTVGVVTREDNIVTLTLNKQKDAEEGEPIRFEARKIDLPLRPGYEPMSSLVMTQPKAAEVGETIPAQEADAIMLASVLPVGQTVTISKSLGMVGWPRGTASYARAKRAVPAEGTTVQTNQGTRRISRVADGSEHGSLLVEEVV